MGSAVIGRTVCKRCRERGNDGSGDNLVLYADGGSHCFACGFTTRSDKYLQEEEQEFVLDNYMSEFTDEDHKKLKENSTFEGKNFRGIRTEIYKHFGVRHIYNPDNGELSEQLYPNTIEYKFSGYKRRVIPKDFTRGHLGTIGVDCELFGQWRFQNPNSKICLIVEGEIDCLSAYQMLLDDARERNKEYEPVVVSPVVGANALATQIKNQYDWFMKFDKIILCLDTDEAGKKATDKVAKALPKNKIFVMNMSLKDPNEYLVQGKQKQFINLLFNAHAYAPVGVAGSDQLYEGILENALVPRIMFPSFMKGINEKTKGIPGTGKIINIGSASSIGKTTFINEILYYWIFNSPYMMGVVSMELDKAEYGEVMLSRHISRKLALMDNQEEKHKYLQDVSVREKAEQLFKKEDGSPRWYLVDDRDGTLKQLQETVEELVVGYDCKVIVLDPLQDLLDGLNNEEQAVFMKWEKSLKKSHGVTFCNVNHVRKAAAGKESGSAGAWITEEDFAGSSTIFKSADLNILLMRDKYNDDEIIKNTTHTVISKCRWTGFTGSSGDIYYDNMTHTLWDKQEWLDKFHPDFGND